MENKIENKLPSHKNNSKIVSDLNKNDILMAEFNYALQTAQQSNEDRVKIVQFIFANIITVAATIFLSTIREDFNNILLAFIFIFFLILGFLYLFQLSRLRLAWIDSVKVMNRIKDYYIENHPEIADAFIWRTTTIPKANKQLSLAYFLALSIIFLNSITATLSFILLFQVSVLINILLGIFCFLFQILIWNKLLESKS